MNIDSMRIDMTGWQSFNRLLFTGNSEVGSRNFYSWLNYMFNRVSKSRLKQVGPDRACAEWLMRNGGLIKWKGEPLYVKHYNNLPLDEKIVGEYFIEAVNADNAAITQHGFDHFEGCKHIKNLRLHQCWYVDDTALSKLYHLSDPLITLEISNCNEVTDEGLMTLNVLKNLETLKLSSLGGVLNMEKCVADLNKSLQKCKTVLI